MEFNVASLRICSPQTPAAKLQEVIPYLNATLKQYEINTPLRISHFLAQVLHESGGFKFSEEIASGEAYEGRKDLGNTNTGDGKLFKGRGYVQLSGRYNYNEYSKYKKIDFISNPPLLATPQYAMDSAGWFWSTKNLNALADNDELTKITKIVNGGLNGFNSRLDYLHNCKDLFQLKYKK